LCRDRTRVGPAVQPKMG